MIDEHDRVKTLAVFLIVTTLFAAPPAPEEHLLLDGNLDGWEVFDSGGSGAVTVEDGNVILGMGEGLTGIIYRTTTKLIPQNFEISLEVKRLKGSDFPCALTFPCGNWNTCASLIIGGWGGGLVGISSLNGLDASENSTTQIVGIKNHVWHKIRLRVTIDRLQVWLNGEKLIDQLTDGISLTVRPGPIEGYVPLSLTSFQTKGAIRKMSWKQVSGPDE